MAGTRFDPVAHAKAMREGGFWVDKTYDEFLQPTIAATPDKLALLAYRSDRPDGRRFTYAELGDLIARAAASLKRLGVGRGDVISVQLPNWWEFAVARARGVPRRRRRQSADADLPRARTRLHARFRRDEDVRRAEAVPRLRPRGDGEIAASRSAQARAHRRRRWRRARTASSACCSRARSGSGRRPPARSARCRPTRWPC